MGLVAKHCVTCGSKKLVMIGGCVWECRECGEIFTVDIEVATLSVINNIKRYFNKIEEMSSHVTSE